MVGTILFSTGTDQMLHFLHAAPAIADVTQSTENTLEYDIPKGVTSHSAIPMLSGMITSTNISRV